MLSSLLIVSSCLFLFIHTISRSNQPSNQLITCLSLLGITIQHRMLAIPEHDNQSTGTHRFSLVGFTWLITPDEVKRMDVLWYRNLAIGNARCDDAPTSHHDLPLPCSPAILSGWLHLAHYPFGEPTAAYPLTDSGIARSFYQISMTDLHHPS